MGHRPLVSIGMPVYNGEAHVEAALQSLLAQDYPNLEIVVCDNASTDQTEAICRRLAAQHPQIRYTRNPENLGPMPNFGKAVELAAGKYFMWAAHDDLWSPNYVSALAFTLETHPEAILATPVTVHVHADGSPTHHDDDRPAAGCSRLGNLRLYYGDNASGWIYGLFRSAWLKEHFPEWFVEDYPVWGGDMMWMASVLLRYPVAGNSEARFLKRRLVNSCTPRTEVAKLRFALEMLARLTGICRRYPQERWLKVASMVVSWHYSYCRYIRRGNPFKTMWRLVRLPGIALQMLLERRRAAVTAKAPMNVVSACPTTSSEGQERHRADAA